MPLPVLEYQSQSARAVRPAITGPEKFFYVIFGIVLPLICFGISSAGYPLAPQWQAGGWDRYITFIPDGRCGFPFYPFLFYSIGSLCYLVMRGETARFLAVRFGLYTGIILSLQYSVIHFAALTDPQPEVKAEFTGALAAGLASNLVLLGLLELMHYFPKRLGWQAVVFLGSVALTLVLAGIFLTCGPAWCVGVYTKAAFAARRLRREGNVDDSTPTKRIGAWLVWLGAYLVAWKWSIANAIDQYATLSSTPPSCYVATAAATGHPRFVRSILVRTANGSIYPANAQLRRLKCVEIALAATWPAGHRMIRRLYDLAGPPLARVIAMHPLLADIANATLKPVEWTAFGTLVAASPQVRVAAGRVFRSAMVEKS